MNQMEITTRLEYNKRNENMRGIFIIRKRSCGRENDMHIKKTEKNFEQTLRSFTMIQLAVNSGKVSYDDGLLLAIYCQSIKLDALRAKLQNSEIPLCNEESKICFFPFSYVKDEAKSAKLLSILDTVCGVIA